MRSANTSYTFVLSFVFYVALLIFYLHTDICMCMSVYIHMYTFAFRVLNNNGWQRRWYGVAGIGGMGLKTITDWITN